MKFLVRKSQIKTSGISIRQETMQYLIWELLSLLSKGKHFYKLLIMVNLAEHFEC